MKPFFAFLLCAAASTAHAGSVGGASFGTAAADSVVRDTDAAGGFSFDFDEVVKSGNRTEVVETGDKAETIEKGNMTLDVNTGNLTETIAKGNHDETVSLGNISVDATAGKIKMTAGQEILLQVGPTSVKIDNSGVTIKGPMIKVEGSAMVEAKAPMTTVKGDAMLTLKGGLTMIN